MQLPEMSRHANGAQPDQLDPANTPAACHSADNPQRSARHRLPVASAVYYPPCGRRRLAALVVRRRPACSGMHLHRSESMATAEELRQGSCGAVYQLRVVMIGGVA